MYQKYRSGLRLWRTWEIKWIIPDELRFSTHTEQRCGAVKGFRSPPTSSSLCFQFGFVETVRSALCDEGPFGADICRGAGRAGGADV